MTTTVVPTKVYRVDGERVRLERKFAEGGEGVVFLIAREEGEVSMLAKLYKEPNHNHAVRLEALIERRNERLERVAAWPTSLLRGYDGEVIGFEMPQVVNAFPLYTAYQIRARMAKLPGRDWKYLVRVARNLAAAIYHVHDAGLVVGDLNESNVLVDADAMVKLIDADSYQIEVDGEVLTCDVGKSELIPPELQGKSLTGVVRTEDHDRFALAILIFHLLVLGRHPYAGKHAKDEEVSLEEAITWSWYAYSSERLTPLTPPPGLDIGWLPETVRLLFERAFEPPTEEGRPTAQEWFSAIKALEDNLATCRDNPRHIYPNASRECPWCRLESDWRVSLFGGGSIVSGNLDDEQDDFDVDALWQRIMALPKPSQPQKPPVPDLTDIHGTKLPKGDRIRFMGAVLLPPIVLYGLLFKLGFHGAAFIVVWANMFRVPAAWMAGLGPRMRRTRREFEQLKRDVAEVVGKWEATVAPKAYEDRLEHLRDLRRRYKEFDVRAEQLRYAALNKEHGHAMQAYLARFPITTADVASLSNSQAFTLENLGIRTALEVTPENLDKHCSPAIRQDLLNWRRSLELHFWQTGNYAPSHSAELRIRRQLREERKAIRKELEAAPQELKKHLDSLKAHEEDLRKRLEGLLPAYSEVGAQHKAYHSLMGRSD